MPQLDLAHIREQGQDMIIFPLDQSFGNKSSHDQEEALFELECRANNAGLAGHAVVIWQHGQHTHFRGPSKWQNFLRSINMRWALANVNKELSW
jgi:hypothetical protein